MVRVVQGKEPLHFLRMFGRRITILQGGIDSGFRKFGEDDENMQNGHDGELPGGGPCHLGSFFRDKALN